MNADAAPMRLRRMGEADVEQVMAIAMSLKEAPQWARGAYLSAIDPEAMPRRVALVAEEPDGGGVLGFAVAGVVEPQAELESIAVSTRGQRRGIGRRLIFALIEELRDAGVSEVFLEVRASNERAVGFYRSLGWCESGRRSHYYADPEEDAVLMSMTI